MINYRLNWQGYSNNKGKHYKNGKKLYNNDLN